MTSLTEGREEVESAVEGAGAVVVLSGRDTDTADSGAAARAARTERPIPAAAWGITRFETRRRALISSLRYHFPRSLRYVPLAYGD